MAAKIDLDTDELIPVAKEVEQRLKRRISPATLWRWRVRGVRGVRLECVLVFGQWCTTKAAMTEFLRASSAAGTPVAQQSADAPAERDPATTRRLRAAGLL